MTQKFRENRVEAEQSDAFSRLMEGSETGAEKKNTAPPGKRRGRKRRGAKRLLLWLMVIVCLLLLAFCGMGVAGHKLAISPYNMQNVYVGGINVGGLSKDATAKLLEEKGWNERVGGTLEVFLPAGTSFELDYVSSGAEMSAQQAVDAAYEQGRQGGMFETLFSYLKSYVYSVDVNGAEKELNEEYIRANMERGIAVMQHATSASGYDLDTENSVLVMTKGGGQLQIDAQGLYSAIAQALRNRAAELHFDTLEDELKMPDFNALYEKLAVEPQDAYFTEDFKIVPEVVGCSFDVAAAEKLWKEAAPGQEIKIPLKLSYPENNEESLQALLYRDMLGSQTTYYNWSTSNRINNIHLAAEKINGLVLLPGDTFSFNNAVGQRTTAAGFLVAGVYNDGQVMEDVGGGICQVSSTLYCAQMYAQLKTTNRVNHHFKVDYLDYGMDATVSWKTPDYKFTNSREYPVKIVAYCDDENFALTIEIWGTDTDGSYVTLRQTSEALYDGMYTSVLVAYKVRTFRDVYDAEGNLLETISEPFGTYHLHDEDIDWPPEKYKQELTDFSNPLDLLEKEKEKENSNSTVNPDDLLPSYDIYS